MIFTTAGAREQMLKSALAALKRIDPNRIVLEQRTYDELRHGYFQNAPAVAGMLVGLIAALLVVTGLGIAGLAGFLVGPRRRPRCYPRQHPALFADQNVLLATLGIALGMGLAYAINLLPMLHYELTRLPLIYLPMGAFTLWLIGQLAVLGPALRAAAVPLSVATRAV